MVKLQFDKISRLAWETLMDGALAPLQQRWDYGTAIAALGPEVHRIAIYDGDRPVALAQAVRRRFGVPVTLISRGPIWIGEPETADRSQVLTALRRQLKGFILITPETPQDAQMLRRARLARVMTASTLTHLKLDDQLRDRMGGKWRNRLRAAEGAPLTVRRTQANPRNLKLLFEADRAQQKAKRFRALPPQFTQAWTAAGSDNASVFTAYRYGERLAAMLFLHHGKTATYHIGWSGTAGRATSAHNLILTTAAEHLAETGLESLDLGLIDTETAPGLARFKLGSGADPVPTGGTWLGW